LCHTAVQISKGNLIGSAKRSINYSTAHAVTPVIVTRCTCSRQLYFVRVTINDIVTERRGCRRRVYGYRKARTGTRTAGKWIRNSYKVGIGTRRSEGLCNTGTRTGSGSAPAIRIARITLRCERKGLVHTLPRVAADRNCRNLVHDSSN